VIHIIGWSLVAAVWVLTLRDAVRDHWCRSHVRETASSAQRSEIREKLRKYYGSPDDNGDIVLEGLGTFSPWPGIEAIDEIRSQNPRLSDMQAHAVAVARSRLVRHE